MFLNLGCSNGVQGEGPEIVFEYSVRASVVAEKLMEHSL